MSLIQRRLTLLASVLVVGVGLDQWTKVLADEKLGTLDHPLLLTVAAGEAGKPLGEVVKARYTMTDDAVKNLFELGPNGITRFLPDFRAKGTDPAFREVDGKRRPQYLWAFHHRTFDMPPRRIPQSHNVTRDIDAHGTETVEQYLMSALPYLSDDARKEVLEKYLFQSMPQVLSPTDVVVDGQQFLVLQRPVPVIGTFMEFHYAENPGAAWGFLNSQSETFRKWFFMLVSFIAMGVIGSLYYRLDDKQNVPAWAFAIILSGAVGNFIDRLRFNFVIDFIQMYFGTYAYPTYNVADIAITVGVGILLVEVVVRRNESFLSTGPRPKTA